MLQWLMFRMNTKQKYYNNKAQIILQADNKAQVSMVYAQNEYKAETIKHKFRAFIDTYH
jgi:predicted patatin/cPLA2 family phospholipase